jgi:hypothetical protein
VPFLEQPDGLSQNFLESWTYSSSLDIVDTCNKWKSQFPLSGGDANEASAIMAGNAELYRLAQRQVGLPPPRWNASSRSLFNSPTIM